VAAGWPPAPDRSLRAHRGLMRSIFRRHLAGLLAERRSPAVRATGHHPIDIRSSRIATLSHARPGLAGACSRCRALRRFLLARTSCAETPPRRHPLLLLVFRAAAVAGLARCRLRVQPERGTWSDPGVPVITVLIIVMLVVLTSWPAGRIRRHVYAVGGNAERPGGASTSPGSASPFSPSAP